MRCASNSLQRQHSKTLLMLSSVRLNIPRSDTVKMKRDILPWMVNNYILLPKRYQILLLVRDAAEFMDVVLRLLTINKTCIY
jgi:hypothetical protein